MMNRIILLLLIFVFAVSLTASSDKHKASLENYKSIPFTFEKGISHQTVYDVFKDSKGFLWFGTMYGLVHYMGSNIEVFRHNPNNKNTLSNDDVTKIFEDSKGNIWIATFGGGFNKIDIAGDEISRFTPSSMNLTDEWNGITWDIIEDKNGDIIIAADDIGIIRMNSNTNDYNIYSETKNGESLSKEKKFFVDSEGEIFVIIQRNGIYKLDRISNSFVQYTFHDIDYKTVQSVAEGRDGHLFIAANNKIIRLNRSTTEKTDLSEKFEQLANLPSVNELFVDSKNNLWIGSLNRLFVVDESLTEIVRFGVDADKNKKLRRGYVAEITEDNSGIIWIGSYLGGISKIYSGKDLFTGINYNEETDKGLPGHRVLSVLAMNNDNYLIATNNGLSVFNEDKNTFKNYFPGKTIYSVITDEKNRIWLGTADGIFLLDDQFNLIKKFTHDEKNENSISSNNVISMCIDPKGNLWAGTVYGLNKIELKSNKVYRFTDDPENKDDLSGSLVLSVYTDKNGFLWAGTYNGLNRFDPTTGTFKLFKHDPDNPSTISNNYVFSFFEDSGGNFWIGTGNGLNKFDYNSETFNYITEQEGLGNGVIQGIAEVNKILFLSSANGISVYNKQNGSVKTYSSVHGLHGNMFNARAYSQNKNGKIIFGGLNGFTIVNTEELFNRRVEAPVLITSVTSIDGKLAPSPAYSGQTEIEFSYNTNYIRFNFSSLDFRLPEGTTYNYRLEGFDSTWMNTGYEPFAQYAKIPAGEYTFTVKGSTAGNFSNDAAASIKVIVTPPFWETWWFYFSLIALFVLTAYTIYKARLRAALTKAEEIEKIRSEEEHRLRKKASADFHDELGHRITKISLYSELLKRTISDQESGSLNYLKKISDISSNLSTGVKDFIWTLDPAKDTLYDVAIRLKDFGDDLFDKSGISFRTSGIDEAFQKIEMPMDWRRHIILIFKEAMNNILKYSNAKNVLLSLAFDETGLDIALTDDGDGFDIDKIQMGRGLKNIRMRAASVHGQVDIKSAEGEGTSIKLHSSLK